VNGAKMRAASADNFPHYYTTATFFPALLAFSAVDIVDFLKIALFAKNVSVIGHGIAAERNGFAQNVFCGLPDFFHL
jgi:hypothetical protein